MGGLADGAFFGYLALEWWRTGSISLFTGWGAQIGWLIGFVMFGDLCIAVVSMVWRAQLWRPGSWSVWRTRMAVLFAGVTIIPHFAIGVFTPWGILGIIYGAVVIPSIAVGTGLIGADEGGAEQGVI